MSVMSGTRVRQGEHARVPALSGLMVSMAVAPAVIVLGIVVEGLGAVDWLSAVVWGVIGTIAFTLFSMLGKAMGVTQMDLLDLLGSMVTEPGTSASRGIGAVIHLTNGAVLAVAWVYAAALLGWPANWATALLWAVVMTALALLMMTTIGVVHPAMRAHRQDDPGLAATNFGSMTPMASLMGHLVYGIVLGLGYSMWPFG
jgi:phosphatidylserine synthase